MLTETHRLGCYRAYAPPASLRGIADSLWTYDTPQSWSAPHRVLPDSGISLCFVSRRDSRGALCDAAVMIIGPVEAARVFDPEPGLRMDAVRLNPEWSRDLLEVDPAEHVDGVAEVRAPRLLDQLVRAAAPLEVLAAEIDDRRLRREPSRAARVSHEALARMRVNEAAVLGVEQLARAVRVHERRLRRTVVAETGFGLKHLQRIHRLNRAVAAADRAARPDWSRIALDAGYYDQPHLIQETRALTGLSPRALHRERMAEISKIGSEPLPIMGTCAS
jgi:AraC-like DNA-binding protein